MSKDVKLEILNLIEEGKKQGKKEQDICQLLKISDRRIRDWKKKDNLEDKKHGPKHPPHSLLPKEKEAIEEMVLNNEYADDSHRLLAVKALDQNIVHASASSFYRLMRSKGLSTDRSSKRRNGNSIKPERKEITGPNQRWCWDISYLKTYIKNIFIYLYVVLDEYSRKVIAWRVSWNLGHSDGKKLINDAIENENLSNKEVEQLIVFNDRGVQMKAKGFKTMLKILGITQVFSRPRTPNDNPFIESAFSIVKGEVEYPGCFRDDDEAREYFDKYFKYYNNDRLHGGISYLTPDQKHKGLGINILENRRNKLQEAKVIRLRCNRNSKNKKK